MRYLTTIHLAAGLAIALPSIARGAALPPATPLARLEPPVGCLVGASIDWSKDSLKSFGQRIGFAPACAVSFVEMPLRDIDRHNLQGAFDQVKANGGLLLVTLEPTRGLASISAADNEEIAALCASYETQGVDTMLRFAHEMNGSWYSWGQQPLAYKKKFRALAAAVHGATRRTAMLWAPNNGGGYPFPGGGHGARVGSEDFAALDTNGDGRLDMKDDMYTPFYPGDDAVDWVGMTIYSWGAHYPWGGNSVPEPRAFGNSLTGDYNGTRGDETAVPNFYQLFCVQAGKPMAIPETGAFFNTTRHDGATERDIKSAWWHQVFAIEGDSPSALDTAVHFPMIKLINWFDIAKNESEAQNSLVDWRISADPLLYAPFVENLNRKRGGRNYYLPATPLDPVAPVRATALEVPPLLAAAAAPAGIFIEAEQIKPPGRNDVIADAAASGGAAVTSTVPWEPIFLGVVPPGHDSYTIWIRHRGGPIVLKRVSGEAQKDLKFIKNNPDQWTWTNAGRYATPELGDHLLIIRGGPGETTPPAVDAVVFGTDDSQTAPAPTNTGPAAPH